MTDKQLKKQAIEDARMITYGAVLLSGVLCCSLPLHYLCDTGEYSCLFCGMRHAIDYLLRLNFAQAYQSNPLIIFVIVFGAIGIFDTFSIIKRRVRHYTHNKN